MHFSPTTPLRKREQIKQIRQYIRNRSDAYKSLVILAARQTMAATGLTVSNGTDGKWNMLDIMMSMEDIGDTG